MKKLRQFDALVIEVFVKEQFHQPSHSQTYYEIVYIFTGSGRHYLNNSVVDYRANDWFLISPEDTHYLEIKRKTHFGVIKFTDSYFSERKPLMPNSLLKFQPEMMMRNKAFKEMRLTMDELSQQNLLRTIKTLIESRNRKEVLSSPYIFYQVLSLFALFQQQWGNMNTQYNWNNDKQALISFIHQYIYNPEMIQVKHLSQTFNISPHYFGKYFKNNYGIPFREYIDNYRIKLIEGRVAAGLTQRQIADEFGFTDESHLSNYFKKRTATTFRNYKRDHQ
ncbi:AraC family transcriptional regulator [Chitinophaga sancti]|uniref:AraC-like ligand binding domain-containing protein n=1 Tax=Chitinophaga sancti TaxID=1004 RepID=A0A1K1S4D7_9BACT|nr:helix-turn-helix transcriptional regulator [Chitinophaga sancti]WQD63781.1 helix-turn-helix transcriptional regulator [Chitinophaga sancti]WQG90594.1 helix-turn-helix transcriptional regulator [Chitinophaga sancti]SFW78885.1 AraC-like ligand binding domain-containing protein [Chitinophaga sancti]